MAPAAGLKHGLEEDAFYASKGDRKTRKPIVEKKRRARINESLQDLRTLLTKNDLQTKMENAEVLELTVKRVESILQSRSQETEAADHEASERFAAGYVQCMHEVHTFVSSCPGIDSALTSELLNHLLENMPLNEDNLQELILDLISEPSFSSGSWQTGHAARGSDMTSALSPSPSSSSSEEFCSDLEETDTEGNSLDSSIAKHNECMWRPW